MTSRQDLDCVSFGKHAHEYDVPPHNQTGENLKAKINDINGAGRS